MIDAIGNLNARISSPQIKLLAVMMARFAGLGIRSVKIERLAPTEMEMKALLDAARNKEGPGATATAVNAIRFYLEFNQTYEATRARPIGTMIEECLRAVDLEPDDYGDEDDDGPFQFNGTTLDGKSWRKDNFKYNGLQIIIPLNYFPEYAHSGIEVNKIGVYTSLQA